MLLSYNIRMINIDWFIFQKINSLVGQFSALDAFGIFLAEYLIYFLFLFAFVFYFALWLKTKKFPSQQLLVLGLILGLSLLSHFLIRMFYFRPRPYIVQPEVFRLSHFLIRRVSNSSFPSGHAILAFSLVFVILLKNQKWGWLFFVLAFLIGLARIFVGVHWPSDILASILITFILSRLAKRFIFSKNNL